MNAIKILDVSLRDGGHRTDFHFNDEQLTNILTPLDQVGFDYIEVGYRNGSIQPIANLGRAGWCDDAYLSSCQSLIKKTKMAVMVHPHQVNHQDFMALKQQGVSLVRLCIAVGALKPALPLITQAQQVGLAVSVNFIHVSQYATQALDEMVQQAVAYQPEMIYFADSNGSLLPAGVNALYQKYTQLYALPFGFHAHDILGLAQANALAAMAAGVDYIDVSLAGMGKGSGNLKAEFFVAYLHAIHHKQYDLDAVVKAANYVRQALGIGQELVEMGEFIRGIDDLSTAQLRDKYQK